MASSNSLQFYLARADEARRQAEAATLSHVRDRCRRSEAAWTQLAERSAATERMRLKQLQLKAAEAATKK
ncbi:MAG TPA: hypothetical protein VFO12_05985 [Sphingomicrobium sp.]|nr:hypothetical protein [Sphingomicrobium sp.]